ncbi:MAG: excinuclease ABC subunit UvrB [SAR324 cluster bacterium]|nr:excinuclease ABC subunit UvrB [SAR324 cluster bacterium]
MGNFKIQAEFTPQGDQPEAIEKLYQGIRDNKKHQVLLGITGSGKTFTMANLIQKWNRPALVMAHNKTLAAQLYNEFKAFFPENAVEYFVSYYDYYQPEAYVAARDLYIEKDTAVNDELDRLRLSATRSLFERQDVVIVSSVSCIYGLGSPEDYSSMSLTLEAGKSLSRTRILEQLIAMQYERNDFDFHRGTVRVRGDVVEVFLAEAEFAIRIELFGDEIEALSKVEPLTGKKLENLAKVSIFPSSHYVMPADYLPQTMEMIRQELAEQLALFQQQGKLIEYHRLKQRTEYDLEMIEETGFCNGIENYSRIMQRRAPGSCPITLIDYLPEDSLIFVDESHVTLPQVRGMAAGDYSRKSALVDYGFRLPSALDNRPLKFEEFEKIKHRMIYVSATPGDDEVRKSKGYVVEQVIRPTGLLDPVIEVRPVMGQVDDMLHEIRLRVERKERVLITTLTKKMAEDLTEYYEELGVRVRYMHSDIDVVERSQILHDLRKGDFDVLIGINLLREGLDLPEVSLVGIFDADKEGFLRSSRSLIQTCGRASRNVNGMVLMYADKMTDSMKIAIEVTQKRRERQMAFNLQHQITPKTIYKQIGPSLAPVEPEEMVAESEGGYRNRKEIEKDIKNMEQEMQKAAAALEFEFAAQLRDRIAALKKDWLMRT